MSEQQNSFLPKTVLRFSTAIALLLMVLPTKPLCCSIAGMSTPAG